MKFKAKYSFSRLFIKLVCSNTLFYMFNVTGDTWRLWRLQENLKDVLTNWVQLLFCVIVRTTTLFCKVYSKYVGRVSSRMIRRSNLCQLVDLIGDLCHFPWNVLQIIHPRVTANFKLCILFDRCFTNCKCSYFCHCYRSFSDYLLLRLLNCYLIRMNLM